MKLHNFFEFYDSCISKLLQFLICCNFPLYFKKKNFVYVLSFVFFLLKGHEIVQASGSKAWIHSSSHQAKEKIP